MSRYRIPRFQAVACLLFVLFFSMNNAAFAADGEALFKANCSSCHKPDQDYTGPALKGWKSRIPKSEGWIYKWVANPAQMIATDPYAKALFEKWKPTQMTAFGSLTKEEIDAILKYVDDYKPAAAADGKKEGQEWNYYYPSNEEEWKNPQPMLCIDWVDDEIHGIVRTWYVNGKLESEKEMNHNKKQGMSIACYRDGSVMLIEEYENDLLVSGKYLKKGEEDPFSRVVGGSGIVTLFGPDGDFLRKIEYRKGKPSQQ